MITSISNEKFRNFSKLKDKKYCKDSGLCLVESVKLVKEMRALGLLKTLILSEQKREILSDFDGVDYLILSDSVFAKLSDSVTPDGVMAVCKIPVCSTQKWDKCLVLDRLQDPSNVGACIRSASAFGFDTILAINSAFPYLYKCIRASMGCIFRVNYIPITLSDLEKLKNEKNLTLITADMSGENVKDFIRPSGNIALVVGNEGQGVDPKIRKISDKSVSIAMQNCVESLNAGVSASILMYLL